MSNAGHENAVRTNLGREMQAFDGLPDNLRAVYRNASRNFEIIPYAKYVKRGGCPVKAEQLIRAEDREVYRQHDRRLANGEPTPDHSGCGN